MSNNEKSRPSKSAKTSNATSSAPSGNGQGSATASSASLVPAGNEVVNQPLPALTLSIRSVSLADPPQVALAPPPASSPVPPLPNAPSAPPASPPPLPVSAPPAPQPSVPVPTPSPAPQASIFGQDGALNYQAVFHAFMDAANHVNLNPPATDFLPPIVPNGALVDAQEEGENFSLVAPTSFYTLILDDVDPSRVDQSLPVTYLSAAGLVALEVISPHETRLYLKFKRYEDWSSAYDLPWDSVGNILRDPGFDPMEEHDNFFRHIWEIPHSVAHDPSTPNRVATGIKIFTGVKVLSARPTKSFKFFKTYLKNMDDFLALANVKGGRIVIPAIKKEEKPIVLTPVLSLAATSHSQVTRLHVGDLPDGVDEDRLLARLCMTASSQGFAADDVLLFGARKYPGTSKTGRFGFALVRGLELANSLCNIPIRTQHGILSVKPASRDDKYSGKRKAEN